MAGPARKRATYDDVLAAPENMVAELIDGELHLQPRPAKPHAAAATALGEELGPPFKRGRGGPGGWILLDERTDRTAKLPIYAREGVQHAWLVDPLLRTLEVLRVENGRWSILATHRDEAKVRSEPFDAFDLELGVLWADVVLKTA
jgi:hypothetical protein